MTCNDAIARFVRARIMLSLALTTAASGAAFAQDSEQPQPAEVIVTGSRIPAPNLESTSPIQVVSSEEIQLGGRADISDVINQLPQILNNSLGQDLGNRTSGLTTAGGISTADLRGLGPQRTLVLVNGRRLGIGSPYTAIQSPAPNLDQVPTFLLDRVDVVTGGASAVYGSDAIAGVINFRLKQNFEGFQVDYHIGQNVYKNDDRYAQGLVRDFGGTPLTGTSKDGRNQNINIIAGTNFADGAGNVTAYFGYRQADPVASSDRDFGGCQLSLNDDLTAPVCIGSGNSNRFRPPGTSTDYAVDGNDLLPWDASRQDRKPPAQFNSQPFIFMSRDDKRYNAGFMGHVDLTDFVKPYVEFNFMNDQTHQEVAPAALFEGQNPYNPGGGYLVNCSNPFLSAQQQGVLGCSAADIAADTANPGSVTKNVRIGRRNVEGIGRSSDYEHTSYRAVGGLNGNLGDTWSYDAYGQYYYVEFFNSNNGYLSYNAINQALLVTGTRANPTCVGGGTCVPYNIWNTGGVTQDQVTPLTVSGTGHGSSTLRTVHADITGDLSKYNIKSPVANDGVGVNVGFEHRNENIVFAPDSAELSGDLAGFGGASVAIDRAYSVSEEFIEVRAPLMQDRTGVKDLVFDAGYRRSDYDTIGVVNTHKLELQYAPIQDLRFRGGFQRAIRAPSLIELFNPVLVGQIAIGEDPCAPSTKAGQVGQLGATLEQCLRTGVTQDQYLNKSIPQGTANQLSQLQGGNVALQAETSNSYSIGASFSPTFLPNFTGSLDYYRIKLKGAVGVFPANVIINNCLQSGDPQFCTQIVREPTNGSLTGASPASGGYIVQTNKNIGLVDIDGIDVQANYRVRVAEKWGGLSFSLNGSYLMTAETTPAPGVDKYDCAGLFGAVCQTVNPRWHHLMRTSWETPWHNVTLSLNWRYMSAVKLDQNTDNPTLHFATLGEFDSFNARIPAFSWLDLVGNWNIRDNISVRVGVNNLMDKNPPLATAEITSGGAANSYEVYDALGRQLFAAFSMKF